MPQTIEELRSHHAVHYFSSRTGRNCAWDFKIDGKHQEVDMRGTVAVNEAGAYLDLSLIHICKQGGTADQSFGLHDDSLGRAPRRSGRGALAIFSRPDQALCCVAGGAFGSMCGTHTGASCGAAECRVLPPSERSST